jgi:hypothetical protein
MGGAGFYRSLFLNQIKCLYDLYKIQGEEIPLVKEQSQGYLLFILRL